MQPIDHELRQPPAKKSVIGVGITPTNYGEVVDRTSDWIEARRRWQREQQAEVSALPGRYICITSVHGVVSAVLDPEIRRLINQADIATPDGMPVVWALRSFGVLGQTRVYGPDLTLALCRCAAEKGYRLFFYGGRAEVVDQLEQNLKARFPQLRVVGRLSPPFRPLTAAESSRVVRLIQDTEADLVFVGLSTPKQERWMAQHRDRLAGVVLIGVGAAFDFHAGTLSQAPPWMQRAGLEWLFRLYCEPRRLWRRYLLVTPLFLPLWAMQRLRILRFADPGSHPQA